MTPAEIATTMTPTQVRALRDVPKSDRWDWARLLDLEEMIGAELTQAPGPTLTDIGRAVLAALDPSVAQSGEGLGEGIGGKIGDL